MQNEDFNKLLIDYFEKIYSGRANECCCGCAGKYYDVATNRKGAERMLNKMKSYALDHNIQDEGTHILLEVGNRWYIAYIKTEERKRPLPVKDEHTTTKGFCSVCNEYVELGGEDGKTCFVCFVRAKAK